MRWPAALLLAALAGSPAAARPAWTLPQRSAAGILAGQLVLPNGLLIRDGERLRTLGLDELAPLRLRWTLRF